MYVDLLWPNSRWQYIIKPRLYNCNLVENRSGFYYTSKLSNCSEYFKLKRQVENNPCVGMILLHYLAHEFILGAYFIGSFAVFQHPYVQFAMTNGGTNAGWDCTDTRGGHQQPGSSCSHQVEEFQLRSHNVNTVSGEGGAEGQRRDAEQDLTRNGLEGLLVPTSSPGRTLKSDCQADVRFSKFIKKRGEISGAKWASFQQSEEHSCLFTLYQHLLWTKKHAESQTTNFPCQLRASPQETH